MSDSDTDSDKPSILSVIYENTKDNNNQEIYKRLDEIINQINEIKYNNKELDIKINKLFEQLHAPPSLIKKSSIKKTNTNLSPL